MEIDNDMQWLDDNLGVRNDNVYNLFFDENVDIIDDPGSDSETDSDSDSSDDDDVELFCFLHDLERRAYALGELWDEHARELLEELHDLAADGPRPYHYR